LRTTAELRKLLGRKEILVAPGAYDALVARIIEKAGFEAVYMTGAGTSTCLLGMPDVGLATLTENIMNAKYIASAVSIPVIADCDTGYGNAINVMRAISEYIRAGVASVHLEDQVMPKRCGHLAGKVLVSLEEAVGKIRAADKVRRDLDPDFVIIARTDARTAVGGGVDEAIRRGNEYAKAGADVVFPESPLSVKELELFAKEIKAPLLANMVEFGNTPILTAKELQHLGYRIVLWPGSAFGLVAGQVTDLMVELKKNGTTKAFMEKMMPLTKIWYEVEGLKEVKELEKEFLPSEEVQRKYEKSRGL